MNPYAPQCISFALANFKTDRSFQESAKRIHFIVLREIKKHPAKATYSKGQFWEFNRIRYLPTGKGRRIVKIPRPFFLTSTASVDTDAIISYEL